MTCDVKINNEGLNRIANDLGLAAHSFVKVGVLGDSSRAKENQHRNVRWKKYARFSKGFTARNARGDEIQIEPGYLTNVEIGVIHEFGSPGGKIPERSFLRMPIISRLDDELKSNTESAWREVFAQHGITGVLRAIGQSAVNVIAEAFATGGFGRWKKLSPVTIKRKGSDTILKDTGQLARSITFAINKGR